MPVSCGCQRHKGARQRLVVMRNNLLRREVGIIDGGVRIGNQYDVKTQLRGCPTGSINAELRFHPRNHQLLNALLLQLKLQASIPETAGISFGEDDITLRVSLQFRDQARQRALLVKRGIIRADMACEKEGDGRSPGFSNEKLDVRQDRICGEGSLGTIKKALLHVDN